MYLEFHYQIKKPQTKIIYCLKGKIIDVVDIRKKSKTYMKFLKSSYLIRIILLYIPRICPWLLYTRTKLTSYIFMQNFFSSKHERNSL